MTNQINKAITSSDRVGIFHDNYGDVLDGATTLAILVESCGDYLSRIIGAEAVNAGMQVMLAPLFEAAGEISHSNDAWREAVRDSNSYCFSEWPMGRKLHDLAAYAVYGIALTNFEGKDEVADHLQSLIDDASRFCEMSPLKQWHIDEKDPYSSELVQLVQLARNRWSLDNGDPIEPAALAMLGNVSEGRIRNLMSGAGSVLRNQNGRIPAIDALKWLSSRPDYWDSVWAADAGPASKPDNGVVDEPRFVPVARDGSIFHPGLRSGNNYTIGAKGAEVHVEKYTEALSLLQKMRTPYWRRPNKKGNWGIVGSNRWVRLDNTELKWYADNPHSRLPEQGSQ